jgi:hypothetical protein
LWQACCDQHPNIVLRTLFPCCEQFFPCCEHFSHVAPPPSYPDIVYILQAMLRACGEHVASLWRACCDHHPNIRCKVVGGWEGVRFFSLVGRLIKSITVTRTVLLAPGRPIRALASDGSVAVRS